MARNTLTFTVEDYSGELSTATVNPGGLTAANYTAKHAAWDTLAAAIDPIVQGEVRRMRFGEVFTKSGDPVGTPLAQREQKWLVTLIDNQVDLGAGVSNPGYGNLFSFELPCADASMLGPNTDELDLTIGNVAAFIVALEDVAESPTSGANVEVTSIRLVGRNI